MSGIICLDIVMDSVVGPDIVLSCTVFQALWWGGGTDAVLSSVVV